MGFLLQAWIKKTVHWVETLSDKEKVLGTAVSIEGHANNEPITIDFLEKRATVKSTSYCQFHKQISPYLLNEPWIFSSQNWFFSMQ